MAKTFERVAQQKWEITAENGDYFAVLPGKSYTTSQVWDDETVTVFSRFWVRVPVNVFSPLAATETCPHCHKTYAKAAMETGDRHA